MDVSFRQKKDNAIFQNNSYDKRRQDLRDTYILNGAIYVIKYSNVLKSYLYK